MDTASTWPVYLGTYTSGRLREKVEQARMLLGRRQGEGERPACRVCRRCLVARLDERRPHRLLRERLLAV